MADETQTGRVPPHTFRWMCPCRACRATRERRRREGKVNPPEHIRVGTWPYPCLSVRFGGTVELAGKRKSCYCLLYTVRPPRLEDRYPCSGDGCKPRCADYERCAANPPGPPLFSLEMVWGLARALT